MNTGKWNLESGIPTKVSKKLLCFPEQIYPDFSNGV